MNAWTDGDGFVDDLHGTPIEEVGARVRKCIDRMAATKVSIMCIFIHGDGNQLLGHEVRKTLHALKPEKVRQVLWPFGGNRGRTCAVLEALGEPLLDRNRQVTPRRSRSSAQRRVHNLAKEIGIESKAIVARCMGEGFPNIKDHLSPITANQEELIRKWFNID